MTRRRKLLLGLVVIAISVAISFWIFFRSRAPRSVAASAVATVEEFRKLEGTWEFVSMEVEGGPKPEEEYKKYTVVFKDDRWTVIEGTNVKAETTFDLDPTSNPKIINLYPSDGRVLQGIYTLEDDRL